MNRFRQTVASIVLAASVTGCAESDPHGKEQIRLDFPEAWEVANNLEGADIVGLSPRESSEDEFRENVNVVIENLPRSMSADTYLMTLEKYMKAAEPQLEEGLAGYQLVERGSDQLGDHEAERVVYRHTAGHIQLKTLAYAVVHGRRAFIITGTAKPESFDQYRSKFEAIAQTVRFEKPTELAEATDSRN
jgi:serine/threonine-protein kinase